MVHTLKNLCIQIISVNLHQISRARLYTAWSHKEAILKWLVCKDKLMDSYIPYVTYNIFSDQLKHISFYKSNQVTDALITQLSLCGCKLKVLSISDCPNITDDGLSTLFDADQSTLERLELVKMWKLNGRCLSIMKSTHLSTVVLKNCIKVTTEAVASLVRNNTTINELNLKKCIGLSEDVIGVVAENLGDKLEVLDLSDTYWVTDSTLLQLSQKCLNIKVLRLHGARHITDSGLHLLFERCVSLEEVDLSFTQAAPWSCLSQLPSGVSKLTLCGVQIGSAHVLSAALQRLSTSIKYLNVSGVPAFSEEHLHKYLDVISGTLTQLYISNCFVESPATMTDRGLEQLVSSCEQLSFLGLRTLSDITGTGLLPLLSHAEKASKLEGLMLTACKKVHPDIVYSIAINCRNLTFIDLSGLIGLTDDHILSLVATCNNLQHLGLKGAKLITDTSIVSVAVKCSVNLNTIVISGCHKITDLSLFAIANHCHYLVEIFLGGCSLVSKQALNYLQDVTMNRVLIYHKLPNVNEESVVMGRNLDTGHFERIGHQRQQQGATGHASR